MSMNTHAPLIVIDNYDSFTYNLVNQIRTLLPPAIQVDVVRNDESTPDELFSCAPCALVISPGPGNEKAGGISLQCLSRAASLRLPVLGVCLGHQLIAAWCGGTITRAASPIHGKPWLIHHTKDPLFAELPSPFTAARYHSLVVDPATLPPTLLPIASTAGGELMAIRHRDLPWYGVQFHPESFLTKEGDTLVRNFLAIAINRGRAS